MTKKERSQSVLFLFGESVLVNADALLIAGHVLEADGTVRKSEQRVVLAATDILTGMDMGATLSDKNVAGNDTLAVGLLHTKTLGLAVTTVLGGTNALLMCKKLQTELQHRFLPPLIKLFEGEDFSPQPRRRRDIHRNLQSCRQAVRNKPAECPQ